MTEDTAITIAYTDDAATPGDQRFEVVLEDGAAYLRLSDDQETIASAELNLQDFATVLSQIPGLVAVYTAPPPPVPERVGAVVATSAGHTYTRTAPRTSDERAAWTTPGGTSFDDIHVAQMLQAGADILSDGVDVR